MLNYIYVAMTRKQVTQTIISGTIIINCVILNLNWLMVWSNLQPVAFEYVHTSYYLLI